MRKNNMKVLDIVYSMDYKVKRWICGIFVDAVFRQLWQAKLYKVLGLI